MAEKTLSTRPKTPPVPKVLLVIFLAFVAGILITGYFFFDKEKSGLKMSKRAELESTADIKANEISQWRSERIGDGYVLQHSLSINKTVHTYLESRGESESKSTLLKALYALRSSYKYESIFLCDLKGTVSLTAGSAHDSFSEYDLRAVHEAIHNKNVFLTDLFFVSPGGAIVMDLVVPITSSDDSTTSIEGIFLLRINPRDVLYPLIQSGPAASATSETALLRREGTSILLLNDLKFKPHAALTLRFPISLERLPAAMAARGIEGTVEGVDYRNIPVLASIKKIPDSPWWMITKIDQEEVYATLRQQGLIQSIIVGLLILLSAAFTAMLWRREHEKFYRSQYEAEFDHRLLIEHVAYLVKYANDIIILANDRLKIIDANDRALEAYGYTHEEITSLQLSDLRAEEARADFSERIRKMEHHQGLTLETTDRRKDGTVFPVEVSYRIIDIDGRKFHQVIIRDTTERKRMFAELQERDYWMKESQRVAGLGSYRLNFSTGVWTSSEILDNIFGIGNDFHRNVEGWLSLIHPEDRNEIERYFNEIGKSIQRFDREYRIVRPSDGQTRWVWGLGELSRNSAGTVIEMFGTIQDITERKEEEEALQKSEQQYKQLIEQAADGIFLLNPDGNFVLVNSKMCELLGYTPEEFLSMSIADTYPAGLSHLGHQRVERIRKGENLRFERPIERKDGSVFYVEMSATPLSDGKQQAIMHDVTERKQAEEALRQSNAFNEMLIKTLPFGIEIVDESGKILFMSDSMKRLFGKDATGTCCWSAYKDDQIQCADCPLKEGIDLGASASLETSNVLGGKIFQINHIGMMYQGKKAILEVFQDVTDKKTLQNYLLHTQKIESLGTLAGGIAHDFNNILGIILAHTSILPKLSSDPALASQSIDSIIKATERGASLVGQLLTFARKGETKFESVRVDAVIHELVKLLVEAFPKTISIKTAIPGNLPTVIGDSTQLHQIFLNLCVNARDAMPKGGVLSIEASVIEKDKLKHRYPHANSPEYLHIIVADTGIGMTEETRSRIFEPFYTTKEPGKGTGLGMSLVYGILENHGGFIEIDSEIGKGTTFNIYLPISATRKKVKSHPEMQTEAAGGDETILVVEDEEMLRNLLTLALGNKGYKILSAIDGEEAVQVFIKAQDQIQLVLSDFGLPKITGDQVYYTIKEIAPAVKMILASGYLDPDQKNKIIRAGVKDFIQKPYNLNEVLHKIRRVIEEK
jgi:PAS domain S-box-containing protein